MGSWGMMDIPFLRPRTSERPRVERSIPSSVMLPLASSCLYDRMMICVDVVKIKNGWGEDKERLIVSCLVGEKTTSYRKTKECH